MTSEIETSDHIASQDTGNPGDSDPKTKHRRNSPGIGRWLLETVFMIALAFLLAQGIKAFILQPFIIPTGSMEPTIMVGDRVLAEKISYRFSQPVAGDIVVFDDPGGVYPQLIKRIVAVEGQTIDIRDGKVYIDNESLPEPYTASSVTQAASAELPATIPEDHVWLMGDNRPNSSDSRVFGAQPIESIKARAFAIYWPFARWGEL